MGPCPLNPIQNKSVSISTSHYVYWRKGRLVVCAWGEGNDQLTTYSKLPRDMEKVLAHVTIFRLLKLALGTDLHIILAAITSFSLH